MEVHLCLDQMEEVLMQVEVVEEEEVDAEEVVVIGIETEVVEEEEDHQEEEEVIEIIETGMVILRMVVDVGMKTGDTMEMVDMSGENIIMDMGTTLRTIVGITERVTAVDIDILRHK